VNLITLADVLVREQHIGYSGNYLYTLAKKNLLDEIGVTAEQIEAVRVALVDEVERVSGAMGIGEASSGALYQGALSQAKKEIDRVQGELASKNEKLAVRAKFFEALAGFQGEMRPDAPPQTAMYSLGSASLDPPATSSSEVSSSMPGDPASSEYSTRLKPTNGVCAIILTGENSRSSRSRNS
jgi:hypothetical protein